MTFPVLSDKAFNSFLNKIRYKALNPYPANVENMVSF